jgi:hypothetical protein
MADKKPEVSVYRLTWWDENEKVRMLATVMATSPEEAEATLREADDRKVDGERITIGSGKVEQSGKPEPMGALPSILSVRVD